MQDRYVGDVGDLGKYGLLRSLCRRDEQGEANRLGVLWSPFDRDDSAATDDGRHPVMNDSYADSTTNSWRKCSIS